MKPNINTRRDGAAIVGMFTQKNHYVGLAAIALAIVGITADVIKTARADETVYQTGFERPTFQAGDELLGLDGWSTAIPPFLNPSAAIITRNEARGDHRRFRQSVEVRGEDLIGSDGITSPYDAVGSYRKPVDQTLTEDNKMARIDADLLLETDAPKTLGEFFSLTIAARSGDGETLGEVGLSSAGIVEAFPFNAAPGSPAAFHKRIHFNKWYHVAMLIDFEHRTTSYFIDQHFLGAVPAPSESNILSRGALVVYARPDGDQTTGPDSTRDDYKAHFDNFRISLHGAAPPLED
ncbi:hypothetical protein [Methylomonas sp. MgM2]